MDDVFFRRIESQSSRVVVLMRGLRGFTVVSAFVLLLAPGVANATGTLDQQQADNSGGQVPIANGGGLFTESGAQTFTAGLSGVLDRVDLSLVEFNPPPTLPLTVEIRTVEVTGEPGKTVLASETVEAASLHECCTGAFVPVTFKVPTTVVAGNHYAIVAYTADSSGYGWQIGGGDPYTRGDPWTSNSSPPTTPWFMGLHFNFAFKTYVTPLPKPTTLTTSLSGEGKKGEKITVKEGTAVTDQATLGGENASKAGGTVTYKLYSDSQCSKLVKEAGTVKVSNGAVPASESETLAAGTYYWQASYSGDENNEKSVSKCGSEGETVTAKPATCGKTTVGKSSDQLVANEKRVNACTLPVNALVSELTIYLAPTSHSGQQLIQGVFYADSKGNPGALLGTTDKITFTSKSPAGWYQLAFSTPLKVAAGNYWIGVITGATSHIAGERYDSVTKAEDYNSNSYTSGPSKQFGSFKTTNEQMSLYATYRASGP